MSVECCLKVALGEGQERSNKPDGERAIGQIPHQCSLRAHPIRSFGGMEAAKRAHATCCRHRCGQSPTTVHRHRCGHDRVLEAEHLSETSVDHASMVDGKAVAS